MPKLAQRVFACGFMIAMARPAAAQPIVVDNSGPGFSVLSQTWSTGSTSGQYGSDYRFRSSTGAAGAVEWRPTLPITGDYQVSVWYRNGNDRPPDARYTIEHAGGSADVFVDQRVNGSQWVPLGTFEFSGGTAGRVMLSSASSQTGRTVIADAVQFVPLSGGPLEPELRACWLTQYQYQGKTEAQLRAIAQNIRAGRMNTVYIAMYSGAQAWWPSRAYKAAGGAWASSSIDYAAYLTRIFKEEGLRVGAWFEYGLAVGAATHPLATAHPDWLARDRFGDAVTGENGGFVFLSPGHPEVTGLMTAMVRELAENYNFDDIQIDRFRWGRDTTGREYGYEAVTAAAYQAQYGAPPPNNVNDAQWVRFRELLVNAAVEQCYDAIKTANPEIVVSSAPTGSYGITQHMQRWADWVNGGYMDVVMPQMYMTTLSAFQTEFNTQRAQAPAHLDKLAVGFRAQEDNDWTLVRDQLSYARGNGVRHGALWVYHQYTSQIAIQDEINNLPLPGNPWAAFADNPFVSGRMLQIVVDNRDGSPAYVETAGAFADSAQADFFRFDSRVAVGGGAATATFSAAIPLGGRYDVYAWHTASGNRNDAAEVSVFHRNGTALATVDQRSGGGAWVPLGRFVFEGGASAARVRVSTAGSTPAEYTSADAVKLVLSAYALGDADGDGSVDADEGLAWFECGGAPGTAGGGACEVFDFDDDLDADIADFAEMQAAVGG